MTSYINCNSFSVTKQSGSGGDVTVEGELTVDNVTFSSKVDKVTAAVTGNISVFGSSGALADSGISIQTTLTNVNTAVPTSGAVVSYVAAYVDDYAAKPWQTGTFEHSDNTITIEAIDHLRYVITNPITDNLTVTCAVSGEAECTVKFTIDDDYDFTTYDITLNALTMSGDDCTAGVFYPVAGKSYFISLYRFDSTQDLKWDIGAVLDITDSAQPLLPILHVTAPEGANVTATNGQTTITGTTINGVCTLYLPATGAWNVSGTYDNVSSDATLTINAQAVQVYTGTLTFSGVTVYGVRHYKTLPSPILERLGDAAGKTFTSQQVVETESGVFTTTQPGSSGFDTLAIYKDIKQCAMSNGAVIAYEDDPRFSYNGVHGTSVVVSTGVESGVKIIITANGANFDVATYYNGTLLSTQTTTNAYGAGLTSVITDDGTINFYDLRTKAYIAGTYQLSGGTSSTGGTVACDGEPLATASNGTWANFSDSGITVSTYYNGELVNTQPSNSTGTNLSAVTISGVGNINFNTSRTASLTAGTSYLTGGNPTTAASASNNSELLCQAGALGVWANYETSDDLMVEIPKYYLKIADTDTTTTIWISNAKGEGFITSPGHAARGSEQNDRFVIYVSRYALNSSYRSKSGAAISNTGAYESGLKTGLLGVSALGTGYYSIDYSAWLSVVYLYMVETANLNSQAAIGIGHSIGDGWATVLANGVTDPLGYHSGMVSPYGGAGTDYGAVAYRGIEGLWGNANWVIAGIRYNTADSKLYLCNNPADNIPSGATDWTNYTAALSPTLGGYLVSVDYDAETGIMLPQTTGSPGSSTTYFCDYVGTPSSTYAVAFGWRWREISTARVQENGLFEMLGTSTAGNALRSMILP